MIKLWTTSNPGNCTDDHNTPSRYQQSLKNVPDPFQGCIHRIVPSFCNHMRTTVTVAKLKWWQELLNSGSSCYDPYSSWDGGGASSLRRSRQPMATTGTSVKQFSYYHVDSLCSWFCTITSSCRLYLTSFTLHWFVILSSFSFQPVFRHRFQRLIVNNLTKNRLHLSTAPTWEHLQSPQTGYYITFYVLNSLLLYLVP